MEVTIKTADPHTFAVLSGSLDLYNVSSLKKQILPLLENEDMKSLVLDLEKLDYMDSSGIALMAHLRKKMLAKEGRLLLLKAGDGILQVMRLAALDQYFTFIRTEDEL